MYKIGVTGRSGNYFFSEACKAFGQNNMVTSNIEDDKSILMIYNRHLELQSK